MEGLVFERVCKEQLFVVQYPQDVTGRNVWNPVGADASHEDNMVLLYDKPDDVLVDLNQQVSNFCKWRNGLKNFYCFSSQIGANYAGIKRGQFSRILPVMNFFFLQLLVISFRNCRRQESLNFVVFSFSYYGFTYASNSGSPGYHHIILMCSRCALSPC